MFLDWGSEKGADGYRCRRSAFYSVDACRSDTVVFISPTILDGSNSVFKRIKMVAKMNFPISSLPSVAIASNLFSYAIMMVIYIIALLASGIYPSLHWLQYIYYFVCLMAFLFSFSLFNSTISVLIRDYQFLLQAVTRLLFFLSPIFWDIHSKLGADHPELVPSPEAESAVLYY